MSKRWDSLKDRFKRNNRDLDAEFEQFLNEVSQGDWNQVFVFYQVIVQLLNKTKGKISVLGRKQIIHRVSPIFYSYIILWLGFYRTFARTGLWKSFKVLNFKIKIKNWDLDSIEV